MATLRTHREVDELIELARRYYSMLADYRDAKTEGRLSADEASSIEFRLTQLSTRIDLQKSSNELNRQQALRMNNVVSMAQYPRRSAR